MFDDAGRLMTREIYSATPGDTVADVAKTLAIHNISAVPVLDGAGALVGIVSEGDLIRPFAESNDLRRSWWLSVLAEGTDLAPNFLEYVRRDRLHIADLMTKPVITATEAATLPQLADLMTRNRIKRVPIVRDGKVVGIISRADLVTALSRMKDDGDEQPDPA